MAVEGPIDRGEAIEFYFIYLFIKLRHWPILITMSPALALQHTLLIPAHVSALTYTQNGVLILGSGENFESPVHQRDALTIRER